MNLPNKITVFRIIFAPIWLTVFLLDIPYRWLVSAFVFALAAATDAIDGHIARKYNIVTVFGKFLDPIADKMLVTAGLLAFFGEGLCNIWIVLVILVREFVITSLRLIASAQGVVIPANIFGKVKTVMQMVSFIIVMLLCAFKSYIPFDIAIASNVLIGASALMGVVSAVIYYKDSKKIIDFTK